MGGWRRGCEGEAEGRGGGGSGVGVGVGGWKERGRFGVLRDWDWIASGLVFPSLFAWAGGWIVDALGWDWATLGYLSYSGTCFAAKCTMPTLPTCMRPLHRARNDCYIPATITGSANHIYVQDRHAHRTLPSERLLDRLIPEHKNPPAIPPPQTPAPTQDDSTGGIYKPNPKAPTHPNSIQSQPALVNRKTPALTTHTNSEPKKTRHKNNKTLPPPPPGQPPHLKRATPPAQADDPTRAAIVHPNAKQPQPLSRRKTLSRENTIKTPPPPPRPPGSTARAKGQSRYRATVGEASETRRTRMARERVKSGPEGGRKAGRGGGPGGSSGAGSVDSHTDGSGSGVGVEGLAAMGGRWHLVEGG